MKPYWDDEHTRWLSRRRKRQAVLLKRSGLTHREVGAHFGVSATRSQQMVSAGERHLRMNMYKASLYVKQWQEMMYEALPQS